MWQLLPLNEVSPGQDSPYAASSSCALEPVYVDLRQVEDVGELTDLEKLALDEARGSARVDFAKYRAVKRAALGRAFAKFRQRGGLPKLQPFRDEHHDWIEDWALYRALHDRREKSWRDWEPELRDRSEAALAPAREALRDAIDELVYVQWVADTQWREGRKAANDLGVKLMGDLPFMVADDSADVWAHQRLVPHGRARGRATRRVQRRWPGLGPAGLPLGRDGEAQPRLVPRARAPRAAELYDYYRVDHVVGLYRTYHRFPDKSAPFFSPEDEKDQTGMARPSADARREAPRLAEDLGTVPDFVRHSLTKLNVPGYQVLRWEKDDGRLPRSVRSCPRSPSP